MASKWTKHFSSVKVFECFKQSMWVLSLVLALLVAAVGRCDDARLPEHIESNLTTRITNVTALDILVTNQTRLATSPTEDLEAANELVRMGGVHRKQNQIDKACNEVGEAIKIYRRLATNTTSIYLTNEASALNSLGDLHLYKSRYIEAFNSYSDALRIYRQLAKNNPEEYLPHVAAKLNTLAVLYGDQNKWEDASRKLEEAFSIRQQLATNNPEKYLPESAMTLNNLGYFYYLQNHPNKAIKAYEQALDIYKALEKDNPKLYGAHVKSLQDKLAGLRGR